ncbi:unannotated protein [freshwater metagenome]|uniref:Unannotated protein n=1 Tax=freshwater metagenome TaxID=449393 RepID=A0A6J7IDU3_9ZZZZ|nr:hypothetical protein [Actinomycetota bacterium]
MSQEILSEYFQHYQAFMAAAKKLDSTNVAISKLPGEWSPAFILHHVADAEMHFAIRYFNALTIDKPAVIPFEEDLYPSVLNYEGRDWSTSLSLIESIGKLVHVTLSPLTAEQWEKNSIHPEAGEVSVSFLIGKARNHMESHTQQLINSL